jgi:hypothetical protein
VALSGPVLVVPLLATAPVQAPEAEQLVTLVDDQVSVAAPPGAMLLGVAVSATVGVGGGVTVTVTDCAALPPGPVQVSVNRALAVSVPVGAEPLGALAPLHPPLAVQASASVDDQDRVDEPLNSTVVGEADSVTLGVGGGLTLTVTLWLALPPAPVQVRV